MITIPANRKWLTDFTSDVFGDVVRTKNLDFDRAGYLALAKKAMALFTQTQDSAFVQPIAINADAAFVYVTTATNLFIIGLANTVISVTKYIASDRPTLSVQSDAEMFQNLLHVTGTTMMKSYSGGTAGTWTSRVSDLNSANPHPICKHEGRQTLLIGDGNVVRQYDTSYVRDTANELTIPAEYVVTGIRYRNSNAYVFTRNIAGGNAKLFVWNGAGVANNGAFGVNADWIYSGCEYGSYVAVVTSAGQVLSFNGAGFTELASFPVYYSQYPWTSAAAALSLIGNVASRGMEALGDVIYININGALNSGAASIAGTYLPEMPSGLWKLDPSVGLYHTAGVNFTKYQLLQPASIASSGLVFSVPHNAVTGDPVLCASQSVIVGTNGAQTYYAIVVSPTVLQLALSPAEAKVGKYLIITGTPASLDLFALDSYQSMGGCEVASAGPVFIMKKLVSDLFYGDIVLFGSIAVTNALGNVGALMSLGLGRNVGYMVTPKISSANVMDIYQKLVAKLEQLNLPTDAVRIKWRNSQRYGVPSHTSFSSTGGTFASSTTFTVNPANKDVRTAQVGDEIEVISGAAAGYLAHITNIDETNASSWVFTIDQVLPVSNGDVCDFLIDNWTQLEPVTSSERTNTQNHAIRSIGKTSTWVQFKLVMYGRDISLEQLLLINSPAKLPE